MLTLQPPTQRKQLRFMNKELLPQDIFLPSKQPWSGTCNFKFNVMRQTEISDYYLGSSLRWVQGLTKAYKMDTGTYK